MPKNKEWYRDGMRQSLLEHSGYNAISIKRGLHFKIPFHKQRKSLQPGVRQEKLFFLKDSNIVHNHPLRQNGGLVRATGPIASNCHIKDEEK